MINDDWKRMIDQARQAEEMLRGLPNGIDISALGKAHQVERRIKGAVVQWHYLKAFLRVRQLG